MTSRKVVQISTAYDQEDDRNNGGSIVTALCDDGSIFQFHNHDEHWWRLPPIPQETKEPQLRSGPVTEEERMRALNIFMAHSGSDVFLNILTDFLISRGIPTEPSEFTDEQIEAVCQAFDTHLIRKREMWAQEAGHRLRNNPHVAMDAMRAALGKLP